MRYTFGEGAHPLPQATDMTMVFLHRALRFLIGEDYGLRSVDLPHEPTASRDLYEDVFGARVRFGRPAALLRVPKSLLSRRLDGVDETLRVLALGFLSQQDPQPGPVMAARVRAVLDQSLGTGSTEIGDVARVLAMHPRTLQRQLKAEDRSFAQVLDDARRARARMYLTTTEMPLAQVAT